MQIMVVWLWFAFCLNLRGWELDWNPGDLPANKINNNNTTTITIKPKSTLHFPIGFMIAGYVVLIFCFGAVAAVGPRKHFETWCVGQCSVSVRTNSQPGAVLMGGGVRT